MNSKDIGFAIAIVALAIYMLVGTLKGYQREERIKEILRQDSLNTQKINDQINKIDSGLFVLEKKDSLQNIKIDKATKKISVTKKKYESINIGMPFLPEF